MQPREQSWIKRMEDVTVLPSVKVDVDVSPSRFRAQSEVTSCWLVCVCVCSVSCEVRLGVSSVTVEG